MRGAGARWEARASREERGTLCWNSFSQSVWLRSSSSVVAEAVCGLIEVVGYSIPSLCVVSVRMRVRQR